ncbi:hypothetical protein [Flavobacterium sp. GT3R68]|uniref:hypothetical protein n=1 Tax=Flavobacterium sp. GT3R68 TaxID=2594437 RepID=UPI000F8956FE|nr:hypothetical protein [Flavobacterium sp. GT3R68]RTY88521.1 hypothetical protein EKL32_25015 [Flavobacterium sp. GSN2]TRW92621.1 hypothetical protein FNW07_06390 [Flavobacterium sp. GT3R68]
MKALKNIIVGFLVSFIGSIPLGYLNIIGYEVYSKSGMNSLVLYLFGVVTVEASVIYFTLIFADKLAHKKKLIKAIEIFSIFFMLLLAYTFYSQSKMEVSQQNDLKTYIDYSPYIIGIIFSGLNFIQIPFWTGWNLYLINAKYITAEGKVKWLYVIGTLLGTFFGMLLLVLFLNLVTEKTDSLSKYLMSHIIPMVFIGLALFQTYSFFRKYRKPSVTKK